MALDPQRRLKELGHDVYDIPLPRFPQKLENVCFIVCNCYESYRRDMDKKPENDAVIFGKAMKTLGYDIYMLCKPHARTFLTYVKTVFGAVHGHIVLFYVGQMNQCLSVTRGEKSFVFDDGSVSERDFIQAVLGSRQPTSRLTMITDTCPHDSLFDIGNDGEVAGLELPPGTTSITTVPNYLTMRLTKPGSIDQSGLFTYHLCKVIKNNPFIKFHELLEQMRAIMNEYGDEVLIGYHEPEVMNTQVFNYV